MSPPSAHAVVHDDSVSPTSASLSPLNSSMHPLEPTSGKRIYRCQECQKVFSTSGHLTRHSKVHTGEKNHICPYPDCQRRCSRRDNLLQHYTMHLTKEERDLPTTYVREALSAMQARMGTYVHPYPRGATAAGPPPQLPPMRVERSLQQHVYPIPTSYPTHRYPEHVAYARHEHHTQRPVLLTSSPSPVKRPLELDMDDDMRRPPSMRRTSSSSSGSTREPITPPMPGAPRMNMTKKEYLPQMPEERRFQVSSVRGTL
ncbi:hypothetical protein DACRYDRAFT_21064 [Dacryopinax primogenitus]|uniref:C2H2-type domain-containing protein n=1 Tax=Dacryopinax primogenitus (strain DJM 731) TaxID=1858805 RepID=M5G5I5_DACPD|nr:uncharacterized protein DACRYDRAFT_21064 [Dacryopinax primogenitus]EJU03485.1 hypothetical protein DACRYDRAFT_21064 [Dacryopinax primogenitus]